MSAQQCRQVLLLAMVFGTLLVSGLLTGCGVTRYQRTADALVDLHSPAMRAAICGAGANTWECK